MSSRYTSMSYMVAMITAGIRLTGKVRRSVGRIITAQNVWRIVHPVAVVRPSEQVSQPARPKRILLTPLVTCECRCSRPIPAGVTFKWAMKVLKTKTSRAGHAFIGLATVLVKSIEFDWFGITNLCRRRLWSNVCHPIVSVPSICGRTSNGQCNDVNRHSNENVHPAAPVIPGFLPAKNLGISCQRLSQETHDIQSIC